MASDPGGTSRNYYAILDDQHNKRKLPCLNNGNDFPPLYIKTKHQKINTCPKFLILKNKNNDKPLKDFNIFLIAKALESISSEKPQKISFTRDGNLLILTKNDYQANRFLKANKLSNLCDITVSLHPTLNTVKGVVYSHTLTNLSEKEIVDGLRNQEVTECKKITKIRDGKIINTPLHILSFNQYELPKEINIAWEKNKVNPYIPSPMQCKKCHRFGHTQKHCLSEKKCVICSSPTHEPILCNKVECINCKQQHRSNNKNCPTYKKRQEIIKHKIIFKTTFREATEAVNSSQNKEFTQNTPKETLEEATKAINYKPQPMTTTTTTTSKTNNASNTSTQQLLIQTNNNFENSSSPKISSSPKNLPSPNNSSSPKNSPSFSPSSISFSPQIITPTFSDLKQQQPQPAAEKYISQTTLSTNDIKTSEKSTTKNIINDYDMLTEPSQFNT